MQDRFERLHCWLDHKAKAPCFEVIDAPIFQLLRELLMRHIEKISQWFGVKKPKRMRKGSRHKDLECDAVAVAKLVMKEREKPGKFLWPHGIILLFWWLRICMEDNPSGIQNQSPFGIMELSVQISTTRDQCVDTQQGGRNSAGPVVTGSRTYMSLQVIVY